MKRDHGLRIFDAQTVSFTLKTPRSDGITHVLLSPEESIEKLAALAPPPRHHFLACSTQGDEPLFVDPFADGAFIDGKSLGERLPVIEGRRLELAPEFIEPISSLHVLARILRNLKRLHFQAREFSTAIGWAEKIPYLRPEEAENYRDLGFL